MIDCSIAATVDGQVVVEGPADVVKPDARVRDRGRVIGSSRFDDEYLRAGHGQFSRQDRTGRACSHHDEVVLSLERNLPPVLIRCVDHCSSVKSSCEFSDARHGFKRDTGAADRSEIDLDARIRASACRDTGKELSAVGLVDL